MNANMQRMTPDRINGALLELEKIDKDAANLIRNYIRGLESRLEAYRLGDDDETEESQIIASTRTRD